MPLLSPYLTPRGCSSQISFINTLFKMISGSSHLYYCVLWRNIIKRSLFLTCSSSFKGELPTFVDVLLNLAISICVSAPMDPTTYNAQNLFYLFGLILFTHTLLIKFGYIYKKCTDLSKILFGVLNSVSFQ